MSKKNFKFKSGDTVKIVKSQASVDMEAWDKSMDKFINSEGMITESIGSDDSVQGFFYCNFYEVRTFDGKYYFPEDCLEKIEQVEFMKAQTTKYKIGEKVFIKGKNKRDKDDKFVGRIGTVKYIFPKKTEDDIIYAVNVDNVTFIYTEKDLESCTGTYPSKRVDGWPPVFKVGDKVYVKNTSTHFHKGRNGEIIRVYRKDEAVDRPETEHYYLVKIYGEFTQDVAIRETDLAFGQNSILNVGPSKGGFNDKNTEIVTGDTVLLFIKGTKNTPWSANHEKALGKTGKVINHWVTKLGKVYVIEVSINGTVVKLTVDGESVIKCVGDRKYGEQTRQSATTYDFDKKRKEREEEERRRKEEENKPRLPIPGDEIRFMLIK